MNLFFEESGDFKAGAVLSQQGEAYQVEMQTGKRTKVKARDVLLQFASPEPAQLMAEAQALQSSSWLTSCGMWLYKTNSPGPRWAPNFSATILGHRKRPGCCCVSIVPRSISTGRGKAGTRQPPRRR